MCDYDCYMHVVNVQEAKTSLSELLAEAVAGGEVVIAEGGKPLARLVGIEQSQSRPVAGRLKGRVWMAPDFDAPLEDFAEYS